MTTNPNLPAAPVKLSSLVRGVFGGAGNGSVDDLIRVAQADARLAMGDVRQFNSAVEQAVYIAGVNHQATISVGGLSGKAAFAFRKLVWTMYDTMGWSQVRLPDLDEKGEPRMEKGRPKTIQFEGFDPWYDYVVQVSHVAQHNPAMKSVTRSCVTRLLPYLKSCPLTIQEEEVDEQGKQTTVTRTITVDVVLALEQSKLEVIMASVNDLLDKLVEAADGGDKDTVRESKAQIANIVLRAQTATKEVLKKWLNQNGHRSSRGTKLWTYSTNLPDEIHVAYTMVLTPDQAEFLTNYLKDRLDVHEVEFDELSGALRRGLTTAVVEETEDADPEEIEGEIRLS